MRPLCSRILDLTCCLDYIPDAVGCILGNDFAGEVVEVADASLSKHRVGDRVCGWVHGGKYRNIGSFAGAQRSSLTFINRADAKPDFVLTEGRFLWKMPDSLSYEVACSYGGVATWTALQVSRSRRAMRCGAQLLLSLNTVLGNAHGNISQAKSHTLARNS